MHDANARPNADARLRLLDDGGEGGLPHNGHVTEQKSDCAGHIVSQPDELASSDPEVLRAALIREHGERRRAECLANMQTEVVQLALDLLVREPDIEGFFGGLTRTMVEESESHACGVWLMYDDEKRCDLWMAYVADRLSLPRHVGPDGPPFPCGRPGQPL